MAFIPQLVAETALSQQLRGAGLKLLHRGKVRDTWSTLDPDALLVVATDRVSIFNFVLNAFVPFKGYVLTALNVFWTQEVIRRIPNHLIAYGSCIDGYLPAEVWVDPELQRRAIIVQRLEMLPIEAIVRGYLTGSGLDAYNETGQVCGHILPPGLHDGSRLDPPIFTPTDKSETDDHVPAHRVAALYGPLPEGWSLGMYQQANAYASDRGIIVADTKFEMSARCVGDELLTPDSSRFWRVTDHHKAQEEKKSPAGYDKQPLRDVGKKVQTPFGVTGIHKLKATNPDHIAFVSSWRVPGPALDDTTVRYRAITQMLTGMELEAFQRHFMRAV